MSDWYRWGHSASRFRRRLADTKRFSISPSALVLDVGSGQDPHPRANVLVDKFVTDNRERACGAGLYVDRPLLLTDATATPFPDKAFDFVFCSHLLEHMAEPSALLNELQRVGKRGYIETPSKTYEKLWGWPFHRWFVSTKEGQLLLEAKERTIFDDDLHQWFGKSMENPAAWKFFIPRLEDLGLLTIHVWDEQIHYEIRGESASNEFESAAGDDSPAESEARPSLSQRAKSRIGRSLRKDSDRRIPELLSSLRCANCDTLLERKGNTFVCQNCAESYQLLTTNDS